MKYKKPRSSRSSRPNSRTLKEFVNVDFFIKKSLQERKVFKSYHGSIVIWKEPDGYHFSYATNSYIKYSIHQPITLHAEIHALSRVPKKYRTNCILIVWRVRLDGNISMSKPCVRCQ